MIDPFRSVPIKELVPIYRSIVPFSSYAKEARHAKKVHTTQLTTRTFSYLVVSALWATCQALWPTVRTGEHEKDLKSKLRPLKKEIKAVTKVAGKIYLDV